MADDRISRRRLLQGIGAAGVAGLGGCLETVPGVGESTPPAGSDDGAVGWAWDDAADALATTVDPYLEQAGDGPSVAIEGVDHSAMNDQFRSALVSGSGAPAFAVLESVVAPTFVNTGGLADLSDRLDASTADRFVDGAWGSFTGRDGAVFAIPWDLGPVGMFYRRDVYDNAGVDPGAIETWADFVAAGQRLPDGVDLLNLPPNDLDGVWRRGFRQLGGQPFTDDGAVNVASETSVRVAETIERLVDADVTNNLESWGSDWFNAYSEGSIATLPAGPWMEGPLRERLGDTDGDWGVFAPPAFGAGGNRATNWGGSGLCLSAETDGAVADRAWDYLRWVTTTPAVQNDLYREFGLFPALSDAYDAALYDEELSFFGGQPIRRTFADLAPEVPPYRYTVDTPAISEAMNTFLGRMTEGELTAREAVEEAAKRVADQTGREIA